MTQLALYLAGGVVALLALDGVPPATQQVSTIAAALSTAPVQVTTSTVNRSAKGDRLVVVRRSIKPLPDVARQPVDTPPPVGCESAFSPVVSPSLAHIVGRCMVENDTPQRFAQLER